jgi:hypothetical protein
MAGWSLFNLTLFLGFSQYKTSEAANVPKF